MAYFSIRSGTIDFIQRFAKLKNVLSRFPQEFFPKPQPYGFVAVYNEDGEAIRSFHDTKGQVLTAITSAEVKNGYLFMGSLTSDHVSVLDLTEL